MPRDTKRMFERLDREAHRRLVAERDLYRAALEEIVSKAAPTVLANSWLVGIARTALDGPAEIPFG